MNQTPENEKFAQYFGFCIVRTPQAILDKAKPINQLFDALSNETDIQSLEVFRRAGREREHRQFLSNVASCPEEVIALVNKMLEPGSPERLAKVAWERERQKKYFKPPT